MSLSEEKIIDVFGESLLQSILGTSAGSANFKRWQIDHYNKRLAEEKTALGKSVLRQTLHGLKKADKKNSK